MNHKWMIQTYNEIVIRLSMIVFFIGCVMSVVVLILLASGNAEEPKQMIEEGPIGGLSEAGRKLKR